MLNIVDKSRDDGIIIALFNVDFKASEKDVRNCYPEVRIESIK